MNEIKPYLELKYSVKSGPDGWCPQFSIGVQTFSLSPVESEEKAWWYVDMLKIAFSNLQTCVTKKEESQEPIQEAEDFIHEKGWNPGDQLDIEAMSDLMVKFAKLHAEAILNAAADSPDPRTGEDRTWDDRNTILESYPLDNIK